MIVIRKPLHLLDILLLWTVLLLVTNSCLDPNRMLSPRDIKRMAVNEFKEKKIKAIRDTADIGVKLIKTGVDDRWYVAYNRVLAEPVLFLYHVTKRDEVPHYIPLVGKSECIIDHVDFENTTSDDAYELVVELHYDYDLAYQGREIIILQNPFGNPAKEIFAFPYEQVWESIDSFDNDYGLPAHSKRIENHASYDFFEGYILMKGIINYRHNHLLEYYWDKRSQQFELILDEEYHEADEEEGHGIVHKTKGTKMLVKVNAHEDNCTAYLLEDTRGHVIDIDYHIHDELLCSPVTGLSADGRYLVYTDHNLNTISLYDVEQRINKKLLSQFDSYEGVSEVVWTSKQPYRFAFITVNHEELLENTQLHIYTIHRDGVEHKDYKMKIFYECDTDGWCVPIKDYHYRFDKNKRFIYKEEENGAWKALKLQ